MSGERSSAAQPEGALLFSNDSHCYKIMKKVHARSTSEVETVCGRTFFTPFKNKNITLGYLVLKEAWSIV